MQDKNKLHSLTLREKTLHHIDTNDLFSSPDNYRLWFEYAGGSKSTLNTEINSLSDSKTPFSETTCRDLYIKHLASNDEKDIDDARSMISDMLNVMVDHLKGMGASSGQFCTALDNCINQLSGEPSIAEVKEIISTVTSQAKNMHNSNLNLRETLGSLSQEVANLREDVQRLGSEALTDALTKVTNRRGFDMAMKEAINQSSFEDTECSLIFCDIDHFKKVNDTFGHQVGDKVLQFIANRLSQNVRDSDIVARFGGEEFAIILPDTSYQDALQVAENLREAISSRQITSRSSKQTIGRMTISCGVTNYKTDESIDNFLDRADQCMFKAKNEGRNKVVGQE